MSKEEVLQELLRQSNMSEPEKLKTLEENAEKIYTEFFQSIIGNLQAYHTDTKKFFKSMAEPGVMVLFKQSWIIPNYKKFIDNLLKEYKDLSSRVSLMSHIYNFSTLVLEVGPIDLDRRQEFAICGLEELSTNKLSPFNKTEKNYLLVYAKIKGTLTSIYMGRNTIDNLKKALECANESLSILTPETHFPVWSVVQSHKAVVQKKLKLFEESLKTYDELLKYRSKEKYPEEWALTQTNMGNVLSDEEFKSKDFKRAIQCYKNALSIFDQETDIIKYSITKMSLGYALLLSDENNKEILLESLKCLNDSIKVIDKNLRKQEWALIHFHKSRCLFQLFKIKNDVKYLNESKESIQTSTEIIKNEKILSFQSKVLNEINKL
eukprot:gene387-6801_t